MKKLAIIFSLVALVFASQNAFAQRGTKISSLPNGWHKFTIDGIKFDVEILSGTIVRGNAKYPDGSTYSGAWKDNQISGKGTFTYANGDRYEGSFRNDLRSGKGTMYYAEGGKYSGKWANDKKEGKGRMWDPAGNLTKGVWKNDQLQEGGK